jgi:hypothetical protein
MKKLLLLIFFSPLIITAQESEVGNWLIYIGNKKLNSKVDWHHEVQYRNYNFVGDLEQLLLRTGIGYNLSEQNNNILVGYGFIQSEPYLDGLNVKTRIDEHRIYQQFIHRQSFSRFALQHRLRFEQRFIERDFKTRFRYFISANVPLHFKKKIASSLYLSVYNELFIDTSGRSFDRNRIYAGLGYKFSRYIRSEIGLMNQSSNSKSRNQFNLITFINL